MGQKIFLTLLFSFVALVAVGWRSTIVIDKDLLKTITNALFNLNGFLSKQLNKYKKTKKVNEKPKYKGIEVEHKSILRLNASLDVERKDNPFFEISIALHKNGESEPSAIIENESIDILDGLTKSLEYVEQKIFDFRKYEVEALLSSTFVNYLLPSESESETEKIHYLTSQEFINFCDMGNEKTPYLPDHNENIRIIDKNSNLRYLPCHFHTREGLRITSLALLANYAREIAKDCSETNGKEMTCQSNKSQLHLYAVPVGRVFMFAPSYVGEIFNLPHTGGNNLPISLEVLSLRPRIFDIKHFFSSEEAESVKERMMKETSETYRMKRSSTGATGYTVNSKRTSENGFDVAGRTALILKRRCFTMLGFDQYDESFADGLQVLRYNQTAAYIAHQDYLDDPSGTDEHDYDSAFVGTNRFATVLLYMSDLPDHGGGEVVFPEAYPTNVEPSARLSQKQALEVVRSSGESDLFTQGSWEEDLLALCRSRLTIRPHLSKAILFYSQHPDGSLDESALHGACPILSGVKWAANLWVWNGPRNGYPLAPQNAEVVARNKKRNPNNNNSPTQPKQLQGSFLNTGKNPKYKNAELYFQDQFWGKLTPGGPSLNVNTYEGHEWYVRVDDVEVEFFRINNEEIQIYKI